MLARWPIRYKLIVGIALSLVIVGTLAFSGIQGVYAYRGLAKSVSRLAPELPLATALAQHVSNLRVTLSQTRRLRDFTCDTGRAPVDGQILRQRFRAEFEAARETVRHYRKQLQSGERAQQRIGDHRRELAKVQEIQRALDRIAAQDCDEDWMFDEVKVGLLGEELDQLHRLSDELTTYWSERMHGFAGEVRLRYRTWIILTWITGVLSLVMLVLLLRLLYVWIFRPLRVLVHGSRRVAGGEFRHRIHLNTQDEMAELAEAMNAMTNRFEEIRDDLDRQVRERTLEVVRSEQLASVGVLAAGVAHEINNPLASIALCAESLESRLHDIIQEDDAKPDAEHNEEIDVLRHYLRMIQDEAFRSAQITERLLDFSRRGDAEKHKTDLAKLVRGVIDMVHHLGKYRDKAIEFHAAGPVVAEVNPQEIKQVVLNLVVNSLDAVDAGGTVEIRLEKSAGDAVLVVSDNGCGMTEEVLSHVFEPFFTRRRKGQGTGLGLAIIYRIVADHGGRIVAKSEGPGRGSQFHVTLPLVHHEEEYEKQYQAA